MRLDFYTGERERFLNFDLCYELHNCVTGETIITDNNYIPEPLVVNNRTIKLQGSDDCWTIHGEEGEICYDITPVSVTQDYASCNECTKYNYKLVNCIDNTVLYTNYLECPECIFYINQQVYTNIEPNPCWYITIATSLVGNIIPVSIDVEGYCEQCIPKCYTITGVGIITYFSGYELVTEDAPSIICASSYPSVTGTNNTITNTGNCGSENPCPTYLYTLTNCATEEQIQSLNQELAFPYVLNEIVEIAEYTGCWSITREIYGQINNA